MHSPLPGLATDQERFALIHSQLASCAKVVGETFFPVMVEALSKALAVRWVLLSKIDTRDHGKVCTVAVWDNGPAANFEYELKDTPCENIVSQGSCSYPDDIVALFPKDELLRQMGAVSYVGTPLRHSSGEVLGLVAALDDKPLADVEHAIEIMELFSGRAAAELERLAASSVNERLGRIVEDSVSEVFLFDGSSYKFRLVNRGARENLGYSMAELRNLTPWDLKPEYDEEQFKQFVEPLRRGEVENLRFETVHQRKDGSLYDVSVQLQFFSGMDNLFYASINDTTERNRAQQAQAHLAAVVASSNEAIISKNLEGIISSWNKGAEEIFGYSADEMCGQSIRKLIPEERQQEEDRILSKISRGELVTNYETVRVRKDGSEIDVSVTVSPIVDSTGRVVGASKIAHDITSRKKAEERERLLMREVNHRAKNLLTLVQVIARQTAGSDPEQFIRRFEERIIALSASHDLLVNNLWQNIPLDELVHSQLGHFKDEFGNRIILSGPSIEISAGAAQAFGMALHELATNAAKYGALSNEHGRVEIAWDLANNPDGQVDFRMKWSEFDGPSVTAPSKTGFGSTVINRLLQSHLNGSVEMTWAETGLVCEVECSAQNLFQARPGGYEKNPGAWKSNGAARDKLEILVVEDEFLIGMELSRILEENGMSTIGPASSVKEALELLDQQKCHAAILDINLGDETSEGVASSLQGRDIPYLTVSGCPKDDRPEIFEGRPHLSKPIEAHLLAKELRDLL